MVRPASLVRASRAAFRLATAIRQPAAFAETGEAGLNPAAARAIAALKRAAEA